MRSNPRRAVITSAVGRVSPAAMGWRVGPALRLLGPALRLLPPATAPFRPAYGVAAAMGVAFKAY